jgi:uncharacterized Zn-finger protein
MASQDSQQARPSDPLNLWAAVELNNGTAFLDETCTQFDGTVDFDFDIGASNYERHNVDSFSSSLSTTTHTQFEPTYPYDEWSYRHHVPLICAQPPHDLDVRQDVSKSQATDCTPDEVSQGLECSACSQRFNNLRALDKHTQSTSHKAWRCREAGCGKSYARRDTLLRHRSKHSDNGYSCLDCRRDGKVKVFKRKDHLNEHIRSCHSKSNDGARSVNIISTVHGHQD